jgi:hypothetical protein
MYLDTATVVLTIVALFLSCIVMVRQGMSIARLERSLSSARRVVREIETW